MTLDLAAITRQIAGMAELTPWDDQGAGFDLAFDVLTTTSPDALGERIASARTSWLVARLYDSLAARIPCPPCPSTWSVLATDGSSIAPDRHSPVHFFVLNIGRVCLTYGPSSQARIDHTPQLFFRPEETHIVLPDGVRRLPIEGARVAARRAVAELEALADLVASRQSPVVSEQWAVASRNGAPSPATATLNADPPTDSTPPTSHLPLATGDRRLATGHPQVALQDGSLILWSLQSEEEFVQRWVLDAYLAAAERLRRAGVPLASYISSPASTDVVNALRVAYCPHVPGELAHVDCERCPSCRRPEGPACFAIPSITDRWLFQRLLAPGERSDLFISDSKVLEQYRQRDPALTILFFYLHIGQEVARVEIPAWVAAEPDLLDLVHATVYDQAVRGQGYPTALQEAHEAAVIHADERRLVERLIEESMARAGALMRRSAKDTSKRVRAV